MGRVTEFIDYINREREPSEDEKTSLYTHITITEKLKAARKEYLKNTKKGDIK